MSTDRELLRQYAEHGDEAAFAEIVRRQADFVYSVALRVTANAALAQEATQTVFTLLARRAAALAHYDTFVGWLHTTTRHTAINLVRGETRRRAREHEAAAMQDTTTTPETNWTEIGPLLDEAVGGLREDDRKAVLLRFFKNQSHQEIGAALGLSEDSARKRVERALEKLRGYFARRGVTATAALLASAMSANSVQAAPAGLVEKVTSASLAGLGVGTLGAMWLPALIFMNTKIKIVLSVIVIAALVAVVTIKLRHTTDLRAPANSEPAANAAPSARPPAPAAPSVVAPTQPPPLAATTVPAASTLAAKTDTTSPLEGLNNSMDDIITALQAGDVVGAFEKFLSPVFFSKMTPAMKAQLEQQIEAQIATPKGQEGVQQMIEVLQAMKTQLPTLSATADRATYNITDPSGIHSFPPQISFQKIDGKWYVVPPGM